MRARKRGGWGCQEERGEREAGITSWFERHTPRDGDEDSDDAKEYERVGVGVGRRKFPGEVVFASEEHGVEWIFRVEGTAAAVAPPREVEVVAPLHGDAAVELQARADHGDREPDLERFRCVLIASLPFLFSNF